ncbi:MAG: 50S ribosomal protein L5 [Candidatus Magasanikbacteria bacterium RIFCSPHIGHO2_01_FULL_33_34]|uniref:Large ribosomal subunit protein uL5 n=1 Tax=Candidatus Magasanikbacteria bacterium RIFCSPHIGHO2_01_FULL_33_34 TaxID=1798671 RepID=A0A1F6LLH1_9BACT|nr:MAG: 50S ribosomal protein L5 [Candidatus Magasanikbacteria bacterium RIFCSPHIGHO2_01_FULL_33_34]OGH65989.1 MAG: 50S ribosomal protein L5 [Candidatus Magasanikbacteria bacterium RIFCSPHIGHO2_02_FULL_33_17]OGH76384.1 MAG: 50S ribosomal protein L5 [Candidatus Magasanikbacteria bacterium RIFCSPLOWO2_01_FULL_33_34]OGH81490.1 MAG: 50S ribosomal protein L5 [Candidatus Magasanikbacteria bacterium RIFCSPLOWO2_12_FULL_34_7]
MKSVLYQQYKNEIAPFLKEEFGFKNVMQVPKLEKVVINVGYGKHAKDKNYVKHVNDVLAAISGQKPIENKSRKSISNFKIREGMSIGSSVTIRGERMYDFVYKLINITFPRIRDFRGINPKGFDQQGNYTVGIKEQLAFPEITAGTSDIINGLEMTFVISGKNKEQSFSLLKKMGFPFRDKK